MLWLSQNWFWILLALLFVGMHLGHGSHAGHGRPLQRAAADPEPPTTTDEPARRAGHHH